MEAKGEFMREVPLAHFESKRNVPVTQRGFDCFVREELIQ